MRSNRLNDLLELLEMSIQYEKDRKNLKAYISKANAVLKPTIGYRECNGCAALMKRYHNDFQRAIWSAIYAENPLYVPSSPSFVTPRCNSEYFTRSVLFLPFELLKDAETNCKNEMLKARKRRNLIEEQNYDNDCKLLQEYRLTKWSYFETFLPELETRLQAELGAKIAEENIVTEITETNIESIEEIDDKDRRNRLIDKDELLKLKEEGKTHQECGDHFGVSKAAISLMLKDLGWKRNQKSQ